MKNCSYCGRENDPAAVHCYECGTLFGEAESWRPKTPRRPRVRLGLGLVLLGLVIGALAFGVPIGSAKRHVPGTIYVSFMALLATAMAIVYGAAYAIVGIERAKERQRVLWWTGFMLTIALCILLFLILDDLGYRYR